MNTPRGLPLLSGPPPESIGSEPACRKCNKEFNILFARSKRCNHCGKSSITNHPDSTLSTESFQGYSYCSTCTGYTALMPRGNSGYDPVPVCAFCIDNLTSGSTSSGLRASLTCCAATAGSKNHLKSLSLGKLKKYADAYNLRPDHIIEKDDLVDRLMSYRVSLVIPIQIPRSLILHAETEWMFTSRERGTRCGILTGSLFT